MFDAKVRINPQTVPFPPGKWLAGSPKGFGISEKIFFRFPKGFGVSGKIFFRYRRG